MTATAVGGATPRDAILVVEDDPDVAEMLAEILELNGYSTVTVGNGQEALDKLRRAASLPRLILLDLMMPVMDGMQFRAAQQSDPKLADVPVILVSAHVGVRQLATELRAVGWLQKPVDLDTLLRAVSSAIS